MMSGTSVAVSVLSFHRYVDITAASWLTQAASRASISPCAMRCALSTSGQLQKTTYTLELFMPYLILFLFLAYPIAEIYATFSLIEHLGFGLTLLWLGGAFMLGILMFRHHKLAVMVTLMRDVRAGGVSPASVFALARYFIAALLLIIPGPIGDVIAFILLLPLPWPVSHARQAAAADDGVIEGDYRRVDPKSSDRFTS